MKTILAPVDLSPISDDVVKTAANLAQAMQGRVVLFTVVQPPAVVAEYAPLLADIAEITAAGERNAERALAKIQQRLTADFVTAETVQAVGAPIPLIIEQAEQCGADYIVMGSHGHTALYDLLVGSTTHGVLMRAKCPVIIVPAGKPAPTKRAKKAREVLA